MNTKILKATLTIFLVTVFVIPGVIHAGKNIPETSINTILNFKIGLELTDSQVKKLTVFNNSIIEKMIQTRGQAQIHKMEIDKYMKNWSNVQSSVINQKIKEYYRCMADLKALELEAIMKARAILSREQINRYFEITSTKAMTIELESELAFNF